MGLATPERNPETRGHFLRRQALTDLAVTGLESAAVAADLATMNLTPMPFAEMAAARRVDQIGDAMLGGRRLSMASATRPGGGLRTTGVERYDQLAVNMPEYSRWAANLERRGYTIQQLKLKGDTIAESGPGLVRFDPEKFTYLDLLHESRHIAQMKRNPDVTVSSRTTSWRGFFEEGVYRYELRLGEHAGFAPSHATHANEMIDFYTTGAMRLRFKLSSQYNTRWR